MTDTESYFVALFDSTSATLLAEKILKKEGIPFKIIPVPRHISSDCGVCIRMTAEEKQRVENALADLVDIQEICPL